MHAVVVWEHKATWLHVVHTMLPAWYNYLLSDRRFEPSDWPYFGAQSVYYEGHSLLPFEYVTELGFDRGWRSP